MFRDTKAEAEAVREGMANAVARYTVALVPENGPTIGSGVLVSYGGDLFVATAQHVADALDLDKLRCIPKPRIPIRILERRDQRRQHLEQPDHVPAIAFGLPVAQALMDAAADVALLRLNACPAEFDDMDFYPLERGRSTALPHDKVLVCGFPFDLIVVDHPTGQGAVFLRSVWGGLTTPVRDNFDAGQQLFITYGDDGKGVMDGHGMSGGGVWMPSLPNTTLWNPYDQILIGVQIGCFERTAGRPFVATRIERVTRLLD